MKFNDTIKSLETIRKSKVIVYVTSDKPPIFNAQVHSEVLPYFRDVLEKIKNTKKISLVINTQGGHLDAPWPLVNLIREYCDEFEIIVPEKSLSAGTLISLGADKIVMLPYSQLSPIDPATEIIDSDKKQQRRIEIEDIISYIDFAKQKVGIKAQNSLTDILKELSREINPTMLGSANRTHSLIRSLAKNLLSLHKTKIDNKRMATIINSLTEKLFSHKHLINRKEAKESVGFGDIIEFADEDTKESVDKLFGEYVEYLKIKEDFNPKIIIGSDDKKIYNIPRAVVHSFDIKYSFISDYSIEKKTNQNGEMGLSINNVNNKWTKV